MSCGDGVGGMGGVAGLLGQVGRESLVEGLHGHGESLAEATDELLGLTRLLTLRAAHRERQADDDTLGLMLRDELGDPAEPCVAAGTLDDLERARDRPGRVGDRDAGARRAVVQGNDLQPIAEAISLFAIS